MPPKGIDTGTGGFPVNGKTNTYDPGSNVGDGPLAPYSSGDIDVEKDVVDVSKGTKRTLASYLSDTTLGKTPSSPSPIPNKYPIKNGPAEDPANIALQDSEGYPVPPSVTQNGQEHFSDLPNGRSLQSVSLNIQRGRQKAKGNSVDGNDLLSFEVVPGSSAEDPQHIPDTSPITKYYGNTNDLSNSVIYNRFNVKNKFGDVNTLHNEQYSSQYELGKSEAKRDMSYGKLAQIGSALSIRAGLELNSAESGLNPTNSSAQAAALLPGTAQLGIKRIDRDSLTAESIIRDLADEGISDEVLIKPMDNSWGTLNNVQDQYAGISNFGMQLLAVALLVALSIILALMSLLFSISSSSRYITKDALGRGAYGAYHADTAGGNYSSISGIVSAIMGGKFNLWRMLGMSPTSYETKKCLPVGALAFFGVEDTSVTTAGMAVTAAAKATLAVTASPGYYSVMARSVSRSFLIIGDSFRNLGKAFSSGLVAGIKQLFEVIDVLKNSKFMRAVDIFTQTGDRILLQESSDSFSTKDQLSIGRGIRHKGIYDYIAGNTSIANRMTVLPGGKISGVTPAWAAYRAPDMLIMPTSLSNIIAASANKSLGAPSYNPTVPAETGVDTIGGIKYGGTYRTVDGRISTETREKLEDALESEFVPFYMHDVRTNEIVSFHAFLASLSDDYSVAYDATDGIGRVESVRTYKNTQRKIGFSFYLVATTETDFDSMWLKINKLTTLVYPQFDEGRTVLDKTGTYVIQAPFSQTISAAPLIRVRIGDLVRSNYSKFNLARLFGYGNPGTKFDNNEAPTGTNSGEEFFKEFEKAKEKIMSSGGTFVSDSPLTRQADSNEGICTLRTMKLIEGLVLKVKKKREDGMYECIVEKAQGEDAISLDEEKRRAIFALSGGGGDEKNIVGKTYIFTSNELKPTTATWNKIMNAIPSSFGANAKDYCNAVADFMSDEQGKGNAVARSFRSSGGKGLAGFIESMQFDWYDRVTWDLGDASKHGRTAPKICKVTVSFSPIHDITPGIDHMGINRAPIYPVGPMSFNHMRPKF